jgi:hypothetical protein
MASRNDYQRVPVAEEIELKQRETAQASAHAPRPQGQEPPASQAMVVFSVSFYLVAAIVVSRLPSSSVRPCAVELLQIAPAGHVN